MGQLDVHLPLSGHSFGLGARAPIPSALGLSGTACLKQGWVGRALRRWPPGREGVCCCQRTREVNVDSGTLQGQWDTTLPVTSWECLKPASLLLQTLKTSKSFCLLDYEDEDEEDDRVRMALFSPCDPRGPAMRGPDLLRTSPGLGSWWGWATGEGEGGSSGDSGDWDGAGEEGVPSPGPASWTWSRWRAADRGAGLGRGPGAGPSPLPRKGAGCSECEVFLDSVFPKAVFCLFTLSQF